MPLKYKASPAIAMSDCTVTASGGFGTVEWTLSQILFDLLPDHLRDQVLDLNVEAGLIPGYEKLAGSLVYFSQDPLQRNEKYKEKLLPIESACQFGAVTWTLGSSFLTVQTGYRPEMYRLGENMVHDFMELDICPRMARFVGTYFPTYEHIGGTVYSRL